MISLGPRFEQALLYATQLHARQHRKGSGIPYVSHLLAVTALVLEDGGDEDEAIAAMLHDAVEDQGGAPVLERIRGEYGVRVAEIVDSCTDAYTNPKPPWRERKERYIAHLAEASPQALRVSLADKLHNARSILMDRHRVGADIWERFQAGKEGSLWYYRALADAFHKHFPGVMAEEFDRVVTDYEVARGFERA